MFPLRPLPRTLDAALRDVTHPQASVRKSALRDLTRLSPGAGRQRCLGALAERLTSDPEPDVRAEAALALADAEAHASLDALLQASDDAHARVRQMAILALGELSPRGHKEACRAIEGARRDGPSALRFQALIAGHELEHPDVDAWILDAVEDADAKVRYVALRLLDERSAGPDGSVQALSGEWLVKCSQALADRELAVRVAAAFVLVREHHPAAEAALVEGLNRGVRLPEPEDEQELIELAGQLGLTRAAPGLQRHAWGPLGLVPGRFAWQAKIALARLGDPRAQREILRGLSSWDRDTRTLSVVAAGRARLQQAKPLLSELAREGKVEGSVVREALREMG